MSNNNIHPKPHEINFDVIRISLEVVDFPICFDILKIFLDKKSTIVKLETLVLPFFSSVPQALVIANLRLWCKLLFLSETNLVRKAHPKNNENCFQYHQPMPMKPQKMQS